MCGRWTQNESILPSSLIQCCCQGSEHLERCHFKLSSTRRRHEKHAMTTYAHHAASARRGGKTRRRCPNCRQNLHRDGVDLPSETSCPLLHSCAAQTLVQQGLLPSPLLQVRQSKSERCGRASRRSAKGVLLQAYSWRFWTPTTPIQPSRWSPNSHSSISPNQCPGHCSSTYMGSRRLRGTCVI